MRNPLFSLGIVFDRLGILILDRIYNRHPVERLKEQVLLCSFEGICGSGKTTQINNLTCILEESGINVGYFHLPAYGVSKTSRFLKEFYKRSLLFERTHRYLPTLNLFLILVDFWELTHKHDAQLYSMDPPDIILFSRGLLSTYVYNAPIVADFYQSFPKAIERTREYCKYLWKPDVILYFAVSPIAANERIQRTRKIRRHHETLGGLTHSYELFRRIIDTEIKHRVRVIEIDATQPIDKVTTLLLAQIKQVALANSKWYRIASKL